MWKRLSEIQRSSIEQDSLEIDPVPAADPIDIPYLNVRDYSATSKKVLEREHVVNMGNYKFIYEKLNLYD
jgi:hypothetical protein